MAGKRIAAPEETAEVKRKGSRRAIWIAGAVLAVLVAAWAGLCLYAGGYGGVFPGVTMAGEDLGGLSLDHAEGTAFRGPGGLFDRPCGGCRRRRRGPGNL